MRVEVCLFSSSIILEGSRNFVRVIRRLINVELDVISSRLSLESLDSAASGEHGGMVVLREGSPVKKKEKAGKRCEKSALGYELRDICSRALC